MIPTIYSSPFRRVELVGVTDVQTIMDKVVDELTNQLPLGSRWLSVGGGQYKTPAKDPLGANRFLQVLHSKVNATTYQFHVKNRSGATIRDGRIHIAAGGSTVRIWCGPEHLVIQSDNAGTFEIAYAFLLDPADVDLSASPYFIVARAHRDNAGTPVTAASSTCYSDDADGANLKGRIVLFVAESGTEGLGMQGKTSAGDMVALPAEVVADFTGSNESFAGYMPQAVVVDFALATGAVVSGDVGGGQSGDFEVLGLPSADATFSGKLAVRKA
ncbi:MAG TPA: hypothetical protein VFT32_13110 [Candidatus Eisenbacteria bacterium]|nr:hypothetical protein [Candidatus Eisenbacteria bacterium]